MAGRPNKPHTRNKDSLIEAVRDYYLNITNTRNPRILTPDQENYRQRLVSLWTLLCRYHSDEQARQIYKKNHNVSDSTSYRDLRAAYELFGDVRYTEKAGRRAILAEWCTNAYQLAMQKGDPKAANRAIENIIKISGLDMSEGDAPDFEKLQPSMLVMALPPDMERDIQKMLHGGPINLNKIPEAEIVYASTESEPGREPSKGN